MFEGENLFIKFGKPELFWVIYINLSHLINDLNYQLVDIVKLCQFLLHSCWILVWIQQIINFTWFSNNSWHRAWFLLVKDWYSVFSSIFCQCPVTSVHLFNFLCFIWLCFCWTYSIPSFICLANWWFFIYLTGWFALSLNDTDFSWHIPPRDYLSASDSPC